MRSFAGFWVDGAVRRPTKEHADSEDQVLVKIKTDDRFETFFVNEGSWDEVYWLDTTTPTELTPQQVFEINQVMYPDCKKVCLDKNGEVEIHCGVPETPIAWGNTTEYPPKQRWRVPTDADKGKKCRCKHKHNDEWKYDRTFIVEYEGKFLARANLIHRIVTYSTCEVLDE